MEKEVVNRFSKFRLGEKEADGIELEVLDIKHCRHECEKSVLGKKLGGKLHEIAQYFQQDLESEREFKGCGTGLQLLPIHLLKYRRQKSSASEIWFFNNQVMVIQPWRPSLKGEDSSLRRVQMWVQIHGLPHHWIWKEVGWKLGSTNA